MDITVYLPDELGKKAKAAELNLSGLLRAAVIDELGRREAMAQALEGAETIRLELEDDNGRPYIGRFEGTLICEGGVYDVYLRGDTEEVVVHDNRDKKLSTLTNPKEELENFLNFEDYVEAMHALGITPEVDI